MASVNLDTTGTGSLNLDTSFSPNETIMVAKTGLDLAEVAQQLSREGYLVPDSLRTRGVAIRHL